MKGINGAVTAHPWQENLTAAAESGIHVGANATDTDAKVCINHYLVYLCGNPIA